MKKIKLLLVLFLIPFRIYGACEIKQETVDLLTPKLNSDRISYFFGSYGVDPISIDDSPFGESRVANLYSLHAGRKVMRTLAIVDFQKPVHESLKEVHAKILEGQSVGIALRQDGWLIDKTPVYFGSISLSSQLRAWMGKPEQNTAAVHVYRLSVSRKPSDPKLFYCTIIEVHSPEYLDEKWLEALYPDQYASFTKSSEEVELMLQKLSTLMKNFPVLL